MNAKAHAARSGMPVHARVRLAFACDDGRMKFRSSSPRESNRCTPLSKAELAQVRGGAAQSRAAEPSGAVEVNPLYEGAGVEASNPLFDV
jgi:hypothetical protein